MVRHRLCGLWCLLKAVVATCIAVATERERDERLVVVVRVRWTEREPMVGRVVSKGSGSSHVREKRETQKLARQEDAEEIKHLGTYVKELEIEWGTSELEIDLLEHTTNMMRMDLMQWGVASSG
ncbi:hypothetical protein L1987_10290 [Smallanthus sonchifolius]|uniref:Uncharacterized protein n=1 Tax=Smallanthus sonchifolius TaxID=185202 RepID=A0ACB9JS15_9ASTR|nr:hypothetical protein L1987_10290 [Smallanthus sonchifolius]